MKRTVDDLGRKTTATKRKNVNIAAFFGTLGSFICETFSWAERYKIFRQTHRPADCNTLEVTKHAVTPPEEDRAMPGYSLQTC